ncbi:MAG: ATP-grasp domain-containing protein [Myxococcota bacterium]
MLVLLEGPLDVDGADNDRLGLLAAAKALGHPVHVLTPEAALDPAEPRVQGLTRGDFHWGVLFGDIPGPERYRRLHDELRALNVTLLNDPRQHLDALELHRTVDRLEGLTARSVVLRHLEDVPAALQRLPPPVFIKSTIHSRKWFGWKACVADDAAEATELVRKLLAMHSQARDTVLVRELLPLRRTGQAWEGFPFSREYRLFVLDADVVGLGYYWPFGDPFGALSEHDEEQLRALAHEVARRIAVPWLCVDVGQLESGEWRVIETGDPSCSGLGTVNAKSLLGAVARSLELRSGC